MNNLSKFSQPNQASIEMQDFDENEAITAELSNVKDIYLQEISTYSHARAADT